MISDKALYSAFLKGDIPSFEELVIRHRHGLVYFIMHYVNNYHIAEEIAQEVFAYIYVNPDRYQMVYEFKTFLFMLGKRRAVDFLRKESKYLTLPLEDVDAKDTHSLEDIIFRHDDISYLKNAIPLLKPEYRQVITLIDLNGLTMSEAATIMNKSVPAIKVLSHRAKKRLKQIMEKGGFSYEI